MILLTLAILSTIGITLWWIHNIAIPFVSDRFVLAATGVATVAITTIWLLYARIPT